MRAYIHEVNRWGQRKCKLAGAKPPACEEKTHAQGFTHECWAGHITSRAGPIYSRKPLDYGTWRVPIIKWFWGFSGPAQEELIGNPGDFSEFVEFVIFPDFLEILWFLIFCWFSRIPVLTAARSTMRQIHKIFGDSKRSREFHKYPVNLPDMRFWLRWEEQFWAPVRTPCGNVQFLVFAQDCKYLALFPREGPRRWSLELSNC